MAWLTKITTIKNEPSDYKICKECQKINWYERTECVECGHEEFKQNSEDEIVDEIDELMDSTKKDYPENFRNWSLAV